MPKNDFNFVPSFGTIADVSCSFWTFSSASIATTLLTAAGLLTSVSEGLLVSVLFFLLLQLSLWIFKDVSDLNSSLQNSQKKSSLLGVGQTEAGCGWVGAGSGSGKIENYHVRGRCHQFSKSCCHLTRFLKILLLFDDTFKNVVAIWEDF